jgi:hypothetical protein
MPPSGIARAEHNGCPVLEVDTDVALRASALRCAAALNPDPGQCAEIEQIGMTYLRAAKEAVQWHVVQAPALLPPENSRLDLGQCAVHPVAALRALAAIRWAKDPTVFPYERAAELARDDDHRVRRSLAQALGVNGAPMSGENQEIIGILRGDVRRSVRTLAWPGPSTTGA